MGLFELVEFDFISDVNLLCLLFFYQYGSLLIQGLLYN